jgi:phosphatidylserine/phosphatidylglycerophosphate/cardiolipin synthase-like enzyme
MSVVLERPRVAARHDRAMLQRLADQAFSRSAGAPLVAGNRVRVMRDAKENYPAWTRAIEQATSTIHVEMYIIHADHVGRRFIDLLARRAREGVKVRLLYDWFGCGLSPIRGTFHPLFKAGGEVLAFNPPQLATALGWVRRNHRKLITVDGRVSFVSGLCVGRMWEGQPEKHREPWRDTGVEIVGPATAHAERAFAASWRFAGGRIEPHEIPNDDEIGPAGPVSLRLIPSWPFAASMLRVDLLVASMARRTLWIADAYFLGHGPFVDALQQACHGGVDVRLLLPQGSDVGWTVPLSRTLYRTLLESGVRIFEWNGSMMHAKTAVADSRWARIGSTNLNINSWLGNWELDVAIEDADIARTLEAHYEEDMAHSTEILLDHPPRQLRGRRSPRERARRSARRALRTMTGIGHSIGAAVTGNRQLEAWEWVPILTLGLIAALVAALGFWQPKILAWPIIALAAWIAVSFVAEAVTLWWSGRDAHE